MKAIHLIERSSIPYADIQRCASAAQSIYLIDTVAKKVVGRLGDKILNAGLVVDSDNPDKGCVDIVTEVFIIPPEYGDDILRFAQDVVKAHAEQQSLDATG